MKRFLVLCSLFLYLPVAVHAAPPVYIGEIGWAGSSASTADEWLELCGPPDADLSGWTIEGAGSGGAALTLPAASSMTQGGSFLISNYGADDPKSTLAVAPDDVTTSVALSNSALFLTLRDANGAVIDVDGASGSAPFAGTSGAVRSSMERLLPLTDGSLPSAWTTAATSAGFDAGATELGTPGACPTSAVTLEPVAEVQADAAATSTMEAATEASPASAAETAAPAPQTPSSGTPKTTSAVRLSEAYPSPNTGEHEWIELTNPSDIGESLDGWTLEDGKGTATPLSGMLLPWARTVIGSPKGQLNNDGDLIALKDPSGRIIDAVAYGVWDAPYPNVGVVRKGESLIRLELQDAFTVTTTPTPGGANVLTERPETVQAPAPLETSVAPAPAIPVATRPSLAPAIPSVTIAVTPPAHAIIAAERKPAVKAASIATPTKKPQASKYKGSGYIGVVASPPGVYSKTRLYALIDGDVREVRLSKAPEAKFAAGQRIAFVAQEKSDGADPYLLANPNSFRRLDASASATFATAEAWPDVAGAYRLNAEVVSLQAGVLEAKLGGVEGDVLAPAALTASLKPGDVVTIEGYVAPGPRPRTVLARSEALTLFKAYQAETPVKPQAAKLPWPAAAGLTLMTALVGTYAYLRHQRLQRLALVLKPFDAEEEA